MTNPLTKLQSYGQSIWYDNIRRGLLVSGELEAMIDAGEIRGVTSNPTIFENAIAGSDDYDEALARLATGGLATSAIFDTLSVEDIRTTADLFRPLYDASGGGDGYVSIEVNPLLANDTDSTISEAKRLWGTVDRPNLMVKIPATREGIPAIEQSIAEGLNINVTLIFSLKRYAEVIEAYLAGLERRVSAGQPVDHVASVASFFVSRVDTLVDKHLEAILRAEDERATIAAALRGRAAVANAKLAYAQFRATFGGERWEQLKEKGARLQRPLWASTSTKNPAYSDILYVDELIGPDTVNTIPPHTLDAYRDHGQPALRLEDGLSEARARLTALENLGISMDEVTRQLEEDGVASFSRSFETLMAVIEQERRTILARLAEWQPSPRQRRTASLGALEDRVTARLEQLEEEEFLDRLWAGDPSLWTADENQWPEIKNRLGWLSSPEAMQSHLREITEFADEVRATGFTHAALLGMGGSSLCAEVLRETFGVAPGYLDLSVLDSTDPNAMRAMARRHDPATTLYIVASKSGTTTEPLALLAYFWQKSGEKGRNFIAITDPDTELEKLATRRGFRRVFRNPPDIGGRYSALSYFGLVPAALVGVDVAELLRRAGWAVENARPGVPAHDSDGTWLGAVMGEAALAGRDKVTLIASPGLRTFGYWVEQLLAESSGKEGRGLVPVEGEPIGRVEDYSKDRLFVYLRLDKALDKAVGRLTQAGHPVVTLKLDDLYALGGEFFRWEIATATACAILGVNAFDQPNVQESKDNTRQLLDRLKSKGPGKPPRSIWSRRGVEIFGKRPAPGLKGGRYLKDALAAHLAQVKPGDYVALTAYLPRTMASESALREMRRAIRDTLKVATTAGYGPRFLHSTGQLHKGGGDNGVFIQIVASPARDLMIPGEAATFEQLKQAQALGDMQALQAHGRRAISVRLTTAKDMKVLAEAVEAATYTITRRATTMKAAR